MSDATARCGLGLVDCAPSDDAQRKELSAAKSVIDELCDIAHRHGWNGVENSKVLTRFFDNALTDAADALTDAADTIARLEGERLLLARLAARSPQFDNPLEVYAASVLRDKLLRHEVLLHE